jgi:predicted CoA-binding protein
MTSKAAVDEFLRQEKLAVVGVSRTGAKFGNMALRELRDQGYRVFPVHPSAATIESLRCYPSLKALPEPVGGVLIVLPPRQTEKVVQQAAQAGIRRVWLQQGSESPQAIRYCQQHHLTTVYGECILMFARPRGLHGAHRWAWGLLGKLPK